MNDNKRKLYDALSKDYDMGTYEQFCSDIADNDKRKKLYDAASKDYDFGDYDSFSNQLGFSQAEQQKVETPAEPATPVAPQPIQADLNTANSPADTVKTPDPAEVAKPNVEVEAPVQEQPSPEQQQRRALEASTREQVAALRSTIDENLNAATQESVQAYRQEEEEARKGGFWKQLAYSLAHDVGHDPASIATRENLRQFKGMGNMELQGRIAALQSAQNSLKDAQRMIDEADHNAQSGTFGKWLEQSFAGGVARGLGQHLFDVRTWDMGMSDLSDNSALIVALNKYDKGEDLTESEQMMLDAKAVELATNAYFGSYVGRGYKAGSVTAESIPFMLEMCINPASGAGKAATSKLTRYALERFGKQAVKSNAKKYVAAKAATRVAADIAGAAAMAATSGSIGVAADAESRMAGLNNGSFTTNEEGYSFFNGYREGEDPATALAKAFGARTIENHSELVGEYFAPVIGVVGKGAAKGLDKVGLRKVNDFIKDVRMSDVGKLVADFENHAHWNGLFGEFAEELVGGVENALVVGDQTIDANPETGVFNPSQMLDTFLGVSLMGGFLSSAKTAGYVTSKFKAGKDLNNADARGQALFGDEMWNTIKADVTTGIEDNDLTTIDATLNDAETSFHKQAILDYLGAYANKKGADIGSMKRRTEGDIDPVQFEAETSYDNGYELTDPQEMEDAQNMLEYRRQQLKEKTGFEDITLDYILHPENNPDDAPFDWLPDQKQAGIDYINAKATYEGMIQHVKDDIESKVTAAHAAIDANTNVDTKRIQPATMKTEDRKVYVVGGVVRPYEDGTGIDKDASSASVVIKDVNTGALEMVSPADILSLDEEIDPVDEKNAVQEQIRSTVAQEAADKIDGKIMFATGQQYTLPDAEGNPVTYQITPDPVTGKLADYTAGYANAVIVGGPLNQDGTPVIVQIPIAPIQEQHDMESLARLQQYEQGRLVEKIAVAQTEQQSQSAERQYQQEDELSLRNADGSIVRGSIVSEPNEDGQYEVYTEEPFNGKKVNLLTREEIENSIVLYNGQEVQNPVEEVAQETAPQPQAEEKAAEVDNRPAIDRIPVDEAGEPVFEKGQAADTWQALLDMNEGNADEARDTANQMYEQANAELEKALKAKPKAGKTVFEIQQNKAQVKSAVKAAQQKASYWKSIVDFEENQKRIAEEEAKRQKRIRMAKAREILRKEGRFKEENAKLGEPVSFRDYVLRAISTGGVTFKWANDKNNPAIKGLGSHLGFTNQQGEMVRRAWMLSREDGLYPEQAAEDLLQGYAEEMGMQDIDQTGIDTMDAFSEVLDVINSYDSPRRMFEAAQELHGVNDLEAQEQAYYESQLAQETDVEPEETQPAKSREELVADVTDMLQQSDGDMRILDYVDDSELQQFSDLYNRFMQVNEIYGQTSMRLAEAEKSKDKKVAEEAKAEIAAAQKAALDAFNPIMDLYNGILEKYNLSDEEIDDLPSGETTAEVIEQARQEVNVEPTEGQKKAGNYKMGHIKLDGYDISLENPKGSVRKGVDENGKAWEIEMKNDYGYLRGTEGVDGDHIDVFLSDTPEQGDVFVVDQVNPKTGEFDEHKVMYGFNSVEEARAAYLANYEEGWQGLGNITPVSKEEFKKWVDSSHRKTKPFAEYASVKPLQTETPSTDVKESLTTAQEPVAKEVDVEGLFNALNTKGEAKLSDFTKEPETVPETEETVPEKAESVPESTESVPKKPLGTIRTGKHTKTGEDLWIVTPADRVSKEEFTRLKAEAKKRDGYYSSFKPNNGFIFKTEEDANAFNEENANLSEQQPTSLADVKAVVGTSVETVEPEARDNGVPEEIKPKWKYGIYVQQGGRTVITRDDVSGLIPLGDGRFRIEAENPVEMKSILEHNGLTDILEDIGSTLEAKIEHHNFRIKAETEGFHGYKIGDKILYKYRDGREEEPGVVKDFEEWGEHLPVIDTGLAPVMYEVAHLDQIRHAETEQEQPKQEEKPVNPSGNKLVTDERYADLRRRMLDKLKGQMNMGIDPEILAIGTEMAVYHIEKGARKFAEFAKAMIQDLSDAIRPYLKAFYNGARDLPEMSELSKEMTPYDEVSSFDVANFDKQSIDAMATAEEVVKEKEVEKQAEEGAVKLKTITIDLTARNSEEKSVSSQGETVSNEEKTARRAFSSAIATDMLAALETGERPYKSIVNLREKARQAGMQVGDEGRDDILIQELVEDGLVKAARFVVSQGLYGGSKSKECFSAICKLYEMQPTIASRSSNRIKMQQYSTPLPMGFVADMFAYYKGKTHTVLEPTAGNGMLVFAVPAQAVHANELDKTRLENLMLQGFGLVTSQDATLPIRDGQRIYDAVIANPPFGAAEAKVYDGKEISGLDPQITLNALSNMKDDGKAAIIIGGNLEYGPNGAIKGKKSFITYLYDHYNVKGIVDMEGQLYQRQGTTYPTMMILIDGRRTEEERAQTAVYPPVKANAVRKAETFDDLYDIVTEIITSTDKTNGTEILRSQQGQLLSDIDNAPRNADGTRHTEKPRKDGKSGRGQRTASDGTLDLFGESGQDNGVSQSGNGPDTGRGTEKPVGGLGGNAAAPVAGNIPSENGVGLKAESKPETKPQEKPVQAPVRKEQKQQEKRDLNTEKLPYRPHNTAFSLESVAPAAMVEAMDRTLSAIEEEHGSIDEFVRSELGYDTIDDAHNALAAEQMDAVAMAIVQMKKGEALIIGDQTGVGKGRQMASLIRWAVRQGQKPIFITQKADLFSDLYRDMVDVGIGDLRPFIFNSDGAIVDQNKKDKDGKPLVIHKPASSSEQAKVFASGQLPDEYDFAVLTYSQVNTGDAISQQEAEAVAKENAKETGSRSFGSKKSKSVKNAKPTPKATFLRALAEDNYLLLDESHTAAGSSNTGMYLQSILKTARAATFASATFAKRPDTMPLYAIRTAMSKAKVKINELITIIENGGVTLQEIMSRALTEAGQMVRRERDMSDVVTDWKTITDPATVQRARENYDKTIEAFNDIIKFQQDYVKPRIDDLSASLAVTASSANVKKGTDKMGVENVPFASKTYNYTKQLMLALKVDAIADEVEAQIKAGLHPVIALESTMESSIKDYSPGEVIPEPTFSASLLKGLDSCMQYTVKDDEGKETHRTFSPQSLGSDAEQAYYELRDKIREATSDIFISPLDAIISKLVAKGYKVGELTGRNSVVEIDDKGRAVVKKRTDKDKKLMQAQFNDGTLDVLILNKSASTGISLHASKKFKDQRQRAMIIAQPLSDINDYMQMIGRIDRTGQVHRGYYINLGLPVPAEQRFLMMLATKLKSLNANTTTAQESESNNVDAPDLLNKYGSQVVIEYLRDNPDIYTKMGEPLKKRGNGTTATVHANELDEYKPDEEDARKITGYVALLNTNEQEAFYNEVVKRYVDLITYLNDIGENDLKITVMPLRAQTLSKKVSSEGMDPNGENPFAQHAYVEEVEMDVLREPMKADEIRKLIDNLYGEIPEEEKGKPFRERFARMQTLRSRIEAETETKLQKEEARYEAAKARSADDIARNTERVNRNQKLSDEDKARAIASYIEDTNDKIETQHQENVEKIHRVQESFIRRVGMFHPGETYIIPDQLETPSIAFFSHGIFCGLKTGDKKMTPSTTTAIFATNDARRKVEVKLSQFSIINNIHDLTMQNFGQTQEVNLDNWDAQRPNDRRKKGFIMTGNILQAIADTKDKNGNYQGQLISFTDIDGNVRDGILMPDKWNPTQLTTSGVPILARLQEIRSGRLVTSIDNAVTIQGGYQNIFYTLRVPKTKAAGGFIFQNDDIVNLTNGGSGFYQSRGQLQADIPSDNIDELVRLLSNLGVKVEGKNEAKQDTNRYRNAAPSDVFTAEYPFQELRRQWIEDGEIYNAAEANDILQQLLEDFPDFEPAFARFLDMNEKNLEAFWETGGRDVEFEEEQLQDAFNAALDEEILNAVNPDFDNAESKEKTALSLAKALGVNVNVIADHEEITDSIRSRQRRKRNSKGWYDTLTQEIVVVLQNNVNNADVEATILHEIVGHKGMRELVGEENYNDFLEKVYRAADVELRRKITELAARKGWDFNLATEEYIASLAESGFKERQERSLLEKIRDLFVDMLHRAKIALGYNINDNDLRYMLWRSYKGRIKSALDLAEDINARMEMQVGDYADSNKNANFVDNERRGNQTNDNDRSQRENGTGVAENNARRLGAKHTLGDTGVFEEELAAQRGRYSDADQADYIEGQIKESLIDVAKREGKFIPWEEVTSSGTRLHGNTKESICFVSDDFQKITKLKDPYAARATKGNSPFDIIEELILHNELFPDTAYRLVGITQDRLGDMRFVLEQDYVKAALEADENHIADYLQKLGLKDEGRFIFGDERCAVLDAYGENVLVDENGKLRFIDPIIRIKQSPDDNLRYRSGEARDLYETAERRVNDEGRKTSTANLLHRLHEAYQDSMLALKELQKAISKETGNPVEDNENAYMAENAMSSQNKAQADIYRQRFYTPLLDSIRDLMKKGARYNDIVSYAICKHGLERNEYMARRKANEDMSDKWKDFNEKYSGVGPETTDNNLLTAMESERAKLEEQEEKLFAKYSKMDFSGLKGITGDEDNFTDIAEMIVADFEKLYDTKPLWEKVNKATKETLYKNYASGLMSRDTYNKVRGMFDYYIPLRGWDSDVAANEYDYLLSSKPLFSQTLKTMQGRTSVADDPFATIGHMAESAIALGNRNLMKQKFLNFVLNNPTSLATVSKQWYVLDTATQEWEPRNPYIPEDASPDQVTDIIEQFEKDMAVLESQGFAKTKRSGLNLSKHVTVYEGQEHVVRVKRNGVEYAIYINGNPRAAQALNGLTNPNASKSKLLQIAQTVKNFMARMFTSQNPAFIIANLSRDAIWSGTAVAVKENAKYNEQYQKNVLNALAKGKLVSLVSKFNNGKLDDTVPIERYFSEFIKNGGETGFTQLNTVENFKREMRRFVKDIERGGTPVTTKVWRSIWDGVEFMNRCAEDTTRFAVYMTSRQMGRTVARSVFDAKEITVNFNKKGSGGYLSQIMNFAYIFFNATIQSIANITKLTKENPGKMSAAVGLYTAAGIITPLLALSVGAAFGGGDDDDEESYWDLPEWVRRNNLVFRIPWSSNGYITIPLPHELRPFYGIGEIAFSCFMGKEKVEDGLVKGAEGFTSMIPLDLTANDSKIIVNLTPTVLQPIAQSIANVDYFGKPIYKRTDYNKLDPEWTKAYKGTNAWIVNGTKWLNELGGGDGVHKGSWLLDLNPAKIEHLYESYLGGVGKTINRAAKTVSMIWDDEMREWRNVPVASSFIQTADERTSGSQLNREYFNYKDEHDQVEHDLSGYKKQLRMGAMEYADVINEFMESEEFQRYRKLHGYVEAVSKMNSALKCSDETRREELEESIKELKRTLVEELHKEEDSNK